MRWGRRSPAELDRLLGEAQRADLSYRHPGSTLGDGAPRGVRDRRFEREVPGSVAAAAAALQAWAAHTGIRARPHPRGAPIEEGGSLLVVVPFGPLELAVPNRIVAVIDEPGRHGFAYGTLVGHDEVGEELFLAEEAGPGRVRLRIRVHARAGSLPARLVGPAVELLSGVAARRYLAAWATAVEEETR